MATLTIRHRRHFYEMRLPHLLFIDGLYAGTMQGDELSMQMPAGNYSLQVQFGGRVPLGKNGRSIDLSVSSEQESLTVQGNTVVEFHDRERLWNVLFDIDLIVWIVSFFIPLPRLYKIVSDVFFAVWLVRLLVIRKRYYKLKVKN